ncbi:MAG: DNA alkylation repair protein [Turicibacter sp.]|nr:DNA alkylation repair protein [Turicibacter sp.]
MPELLKDVYNPESVREFALKMQAVYPPFQVAAFLSAVLDDTWEGLGLLARERRISTMLGTFLPDDYEAALNLIDLVVADYASLFFGTIFPDFVEVYGQGDADWDLSIAALKRYTVYSTSEFAVRPFIVNHEERMMAMMYEWSKDENEHVRRLASEGCRPALPWGKALVKYKKDPTPILPILEQLKADPSLYVRKSVANNLNDISKTHPDLVAKIARDWYGENEWTNWIVKHACRTLLKRGNREVLAIFGYDDGATIEVADFALSTDSVSMGDSLTFSFQLSAVDDTKVRLEYGIDFMKANGKRNRKVFQISESTLKKGSQKIFSKKHAFADLTTRKHYPGVHAVTLIVNGVARGTLDFELGE